ncbi:DUF6496 domain-containing protein [Achromobacter sp. AGC78]|jgi:hypothetical protein|uniref:DUF6496 domain-containing protein n=1 Tax=Achromobacter spanius TaxID=217203 RepID=A0AA42S6K2_9BURK|nr:MULTISPECIES: DUF6496 domain-containing protein [Achromobacter]MCS3504545.1 membrane protein involved in colicin uptake [Achromobacter sp. JUb104]MDH0739330.1 DUF6496 domain-containing protein [Achromobacter spanius]
MPERKTLERAKQDKREGKSASTQAGEFVREEIEHVREGKHGVRSTKQAIAIGLSKARRAGVKASPSKNASPSTKRHAKKDLEAAHDGHAKSSTRSRATTKALKKESTKPASRSALSHHASKTASRRTAADRSAAAKKAAATKGAAGRSAAAKKAARTRAKNKAAAGSHHHAAH